jgi:hypothetical protein
MSTGFRRLSGNCRFDKEGNVATQHVRDSPLRQFRPQLGTVKRGEAVVDHAQLPGVERETVHDVQWPVTVEGTPQAWGLILLGVSLQGMHQEIARTRWQLAGFVVLGILAGSLASIVLARRAAR